MRVRDWNLVDEDGKEHLVVRGLERNSCADGHFNYDTFPPFRDYFNFPKNANIAKVESWICDNFGFRKEEMPSPQSAKAYTSKKVSAFFECCAELGFVRSQSEFHGLKSNATFMGPFSSV